MFCEYSVPLQGLQSAEGRLLAAAREIALPPGGRIAGEIVNRPTPDVADSLTLSGGVDFSAALIAAKQAKLAAEANLRVISMQRELEYSTLDLFA
jgi:hypothetical protein